MRPEVLGRHIYSATKQEVLDTLPLVRQVASLDAITTTVLIRLTVELATLPAILLEEAADGYTAQAVGITIAVYNLQPLELHYSRDIGIDCTPY